MQFTLLIFAALLVYSAEVLSKNVSCANLQSAVRINQIQKENLSSRLEKLDGQFKEHLERDIDAQADGLFDNFHRNKAKKVYFAKRSLNRAIEKKNKNIKSMKRYYCTKCTRDPDQVTFCELCPKSSKCEAKDL